MKKVLQHPARPWLPMWAGTGSQRLPSPGLRLPPNWLHSQFPEFWLELPDSTSHPGLLC